ncbi:MAG: EAL domain-containing protein [Campylobacterota bacterium]|nr:EAL domain-containing protein [Campylobacterota bacterium]
MNLYINKNYFIIILVLISFLMVGFLYTLGGDAFSYALMGIVLLLSLLFIAVLFMRESKHRKDYNKLQEIVGRDPLTSLLNRRGVNDFVVQMIARNRRKNSEFAILYLDMDNFKTINDTLGHHIGDKVLLEVAERLKQIVREYDEVGRIGGDEFVLLVDAINTSEDAALSAQRILEAFKNPLFIEGNCIDISFSIGISIYPENGEEQYKLFKSADIAMYQAKEQGKNRYQFYTKALDQKVKDNIVMEHTLRDALANNEFVLFYQPKINLADSSKHELEALIRWEHPDKGLVMPSEFIPHAEKSNLILLMGAWVIDMVCKQVKYCQEQGLSMQISINLSIEQLKDRKFLAMLKESIQKNEIAASSLEFEISEAILMKDSRKLISTLNSLKELGVKLAIDEFGKGYSSLGYMTRLPIDKIKIDKTLINEIGINPKNRQLVSAMVALGHVMNMSVTAEGIEVDSHLQESKKLNVDAAQGYFLAEPLAADQIIDFYKTFQIKAS